MNYQDLIISICEKNNIELNILSNNWVYLLKKDGIQRFITGYKFDLNKQALSNIFDDKYATYEILKSNLIDVIEHNLYYPKESSDNYLYDLFYKYNKNIVIKRNNGTCGKDVYHIDTIDSLNDFKTKCNLYNSSFSVCPYYNILNEYRVIILKNEIKLIYKKELPVVYGDDISTINQLLDKFNYNYFHNRHSLENNIVLANGQEFRYGWKFNLSNGSRVSFDIDDKILEKIKSIIFLLTSKIEIGFASVDIIRCDNEKYYILEINSGVMMSNLMNYDSLLPTIASIYEEAILEMFRS